MPMYWVVKFSGSGKTYTMQPLPLRASGDILKLMNQPYYQEQSAHKEYICRAGSGEHTLGTDLSYMLYLV